MNLEVEQTLKEEWTLGTTWETRGYLLLYQSSKEQFTSFLAQAQIGFRSRTEECVGPAVTRGERQSKGDQPGGLCPLSTGHAAPPHEQPCYSFISAGQQAELEQTSSQQTCYVG